MRGEGNPFGKGFSLSPHAPLSLPKTFVPVFGRWCSATGGRRWAVPRMAWEGGKFCSAMQKRPVKMTGRFCIHRVRGRAGLASFTACHVIHLGSWRADIQGQDDAGYFVSCKNVQMRGGRSVSGRAPRIWRPRIRRRGPACRSEKEVLEGRGKADQGRPSGPCPLRRRKLRASRAGWRENLFSKRFPSPVALLAHSTAGPDRCRAGRLRDRHPDGRGPLRQRPCR